MGNVPASSWSSDMGNVIRMTEGQARKVYALLKKACCNYMSGQCIALDCPCPQLITRSLICKWFMRAVLPGDAPLYVELTGNRGRTKPCAVCGQPFYPRARNAKYCDKCARTVQRQQQREHMRKKRDEC